MVAMDKSMTKLTHEACHPARSGVALAFFVPHEYWPSKFTITISIIPTKPGKEPIGLNPGCGMNWTES